MATDNDLDHYAEYYSQKLWELLPAVYRAEDSADPYTKGPLQELVERVGVQAAIVRRSIDRLWEDQSIETCDAWLIDYFADLLATNVVSSLDEAQRRRDVARTIYYRRRKGTVALLEELAGDITEWSVHVVEFFRRMSRTRHNLDPAIGPRAKPGSDQEQLQFAQGLVGPRSHTPAGGYADLRNVLAARLAPGRNDSTVITGAFDEYFHTADVRRGRGATGWYGISHLGVFVWRLESFPVVKATPVQDKNCPNQFTFDPTGRDIPLFGSGLRDFGRKWTAPAPEEMPGPILNELLEVAFASFYGEGERHSLCVRDALGVIPAARFNKDKTKAPFWIDAQRGRVYRHIGQTHVDPSLVDYHYGFSADIGAGTKDRRGKVSDEGTAVATGDPALFTALQNVGASGALQIADSLTYTKIKPLTGVVDVALRAKNLQRPVIRATTTNEWVFTGSGPDAKLELTGLLISGGTRVVLQGEFETVTLSYCTLDPGNWDTKNTAWSVAADGVELKASRLVIDGKVRKLVIRNCIVGPITCARFELAPTITIEDSIIQAVEPGVNAVILANGELALRRCTLLGPALVHRFDASESILHDQVTVADVQHGCIRFTAWASGPDTKLPRKYESVRIIPRAVLFRSTFFGQPAYAQLTELAGASIREGAENGSEMGAFASAKSSIKERSLLIKFAEYLPLGLEPVIVHVT